MIKFDEIWLSPDEVAFIFKNSNNIFILTNHGDIENPEIQQNIDEYINENPNLKSLNIIYSTSINIQNIILSSIEPLEK